MVGTMYVMFWILVPDEDSSSAHTRTDAHRGNEDLRASFNIVLIYRTKRKVVPCHSDVRVH